MFIDFQGESRTFIVRLIVAALLGALIGFERDSYHGIIQSVEQANIPLKSIRWDRP